MVFRYLCLCSVIVIDTLSRVMTVHRPDCEAYSQDECLGDFFFNWNLPSVHFTHNINADLFLWLLEAR